jgi:hypothetical protein
MKKLVLQFASGYRLGHYCTDAQINFMSEREPSAGIQLMFRGGGTVSLPNDYELTVGPCVGLSLETVEQETPQSYRKVRESMKTDIRQAFANLTGSGVPEPALARMLADLAIAYLELPEEKLQEWYDPLDQGQG